MDRSREPQERESSPNLGEGVEAFWGGVTMPCCLAVPPEVTGPQWDCTMEEGGAQTGKEQ